MIKYQYKYTAISYMIFLQDLNCFRLKYKKSGFNWNKL